MRRSSLILAALLIATSHFAQAQVPSGARLRIDKLPTHPVRGLTTAETKAFQSQIQQLVDAVAAQRAIAQPPAPVCTALHPWIEQGVSDEGIAMATLLIGLPATRKGGVCDFGANTSIDVWINRLKPLFTCGDPVDGETFCTLVALNPGPDGFLMHRGPKKIYYVWNQSSAPLMVPVTREEYLRARERHWARQVREMREQYDKLPAQYRTDDSGIRQMEALLAEVRAELNALAPADRAAPACIPNLNSKVDARTPFWSYGRQCEPGFMLGRPNTAIFREAPSKASIRTVVFETLSGRTGAVEPYLHEYKLKLLQEFDFAALARALPPRH
jgi:hypothetical protein